MKRGLGHGVSSGGRGNGVLSHGDAAVEASGGVSLIKAVAISGVFDLSMLLRNPIGAGRSILTKIEVRYSTRRVICTLTCWEEHKDNHESRNVNGCLEWNSHMPIYLDECIDASISPHLMCL